LKQHFFHPVWEGGEAPASVEACEAVLGAHFGHECVVTGSGRSALDLAMRQAGLGRYRSRIALTPMISRCVFDVAVIHAYPVDPAGREHHDLVLRYHQMGIPQAGGDFSVPVIEDICHAFHADPHACVPQAGKGWAVFSLPKFFPVAGMAGGIVVRDRDEAQALRTMRDRSPPLSDAEQRSQAEDFQRAYGGDPSHADRLEMLYLKRRLNSRCHVADLAGFPPAASALHIQTSRRREVMRHLLAGLDESLFPDSWHGQLESWLPFALPVFLDGEERMNAAAGSLNATGIQSGVYSIDVARNQAQPDMRRAVVVPCHQQLDDAACDMIVSALKGVNR
jgi:dTDP-4-amino-4,6-dideoxygalactose transaminase